MLTTVGENDIMFETFFIINYNCLLEKKKNNSVCLLRIFEKKTSKIYFS